MKKLLIIGIVFITIALGLTIYSELINKRINIYEITSTGLKKDNQKVYLDATYVAGTITSDDVYGYYVIFGDGVQYIVYMKNKNANKLNSYLLDNPEESKRVVGVTKLIPETLEENGKEFVKTWLDENHTHDNNEKDDHNITTDDFYHYFGYVYLDSTNCDLERIFIYVTGIIGIVCLMYYFNTKYQFIG